MSTPDCTRCGKPADYWTCCGNPADGSAGTTCDHDGGETVCEACWARQEQAGELSSAGE